MSKVDVPPKKIVPMTANTMTKLWKLSHDNVMVGQYTISIDEKWVTISEHVYGESERASVTVPKEAFTKLARWYFNGKVPREDAASRNPKTHQKMLVR